MNKLLRLLWLLLVSARRAPASPFGPCVTPFRVWFTDLDVLLHMNNGTYFSIMDLARVDLMIRAGMIGRIRKQGWYPVVVAETIQLRRSLNLLQRFDIETRVCGWDDKAIVLEQQFIRRGEVVAHALVRTRFLSKQGGSVTPAELMQMLGLDATSPALGDYAARWNADQAQWQGGRGAVQTPQ
jgi:acyl-CoA thioesterase FadM